MKYNLINRSSASKFLKPFRYLLMPLLYLFTSHAYADGTGTDLLTSTTSDLSATVTGSGVKILYLAEMIFCTYIYIRTRNPLVFGGVIVLALGINVILRFADLTALTPHA